MSTRNNTNKFDNQFINIIEIYNQYKQISWLDTNETSRIVQCPYPERIESEPFRIVPIWLTVVLIRATLGLVTHRCYRFK